MKATLRTDITIGEICKGFQYSAAEEKGLFGWDGKLVIQPEYQRSYIYAEKGMDAPVVDSVLKGYPIGLIYLNKVDENRYEILDGQQRITSLGRFRTNKLPIVLDSGVQQYYDGIGEDRKRLFDETRLVIYICEGTETEIKEWFKTINIQGLPLKRQELLNAIFSGPFVTRAKETFSNSQNSNVQKWSAYVSGEVKRQDYLATALEWVSAAKIGDEELASAPGADKDKVSLYMSRHRRDEQITELKNYFETVIDWASTVFTDVEKVLQGQPWGAFYERYHNTPYSAADVSAKLQRLLGDEQVGNKRGTPEFILGGEKDARLLNVRVFDERTKKAVYARQTAAAEKKGVSNCPLCAVGHEANAKRVWKFDEMDADHVAAWSKGGATDVSNCQMLCKTHNRAKGNR